MNAATLRSEIGTFIERNPGWAGMGDSMLRIIECGERDRRRIATLTAERAALTARLATITAAGIVIGEDGAVRWHGLTGAEIEAMRDIVADFGPGTAWVYFNEDAGSDDAAPVQEMERRIADALAAAAGRGAEGEAT